MDRETDPFVMGYDAYWDSVPASECPFLDGTDEAADWTLGWEDAFEEDMEDEYEDDWDEEEWDDDEWYYDDEEF